MEEKNEKKKMEENNEKKKMEEKNEKKKMNRKESDQKKVKKDKGRRRKVGEDGKREEEEGKKRGRQKTKNTESYLFIFFRASSLFLHSLPPLCPPSFINGYTCALTLFGDGAQTKNDNKRRLVA